MTTLYNSNGDKIEIESEIVAYVGKRSAEPMRGINHMGFNTVAPENTLPAYKLSKTNGFKYVETDVQFTSDNVPVLLHDATINRTSNGTGNIADLTFEQVRSYDFGSWKSADYAGTLIPSFEEFLVLCKALDLHPYVEIKQGVTYSEAQIKLLCDICADCNMLDNTTWISFDVNYLKIVKKYIPTARLGCIVNLLNSSSITAAQNLKTGANEVFITARIDNSPDISLCKSASIPLELWTIDNANTIIGLDSYISGVTSNSLDATKVLYNNAMGI